MFSASSVIDTIAQSLTAIRREDGLTFDDMGAIMGKSADQAAKYCAGSATMDAITYARCRREWNGRFDGALDRLCHDTRPTAQADRACQSMVLKAALALSIALEDDDEITPSEVRANRGTIEEARDALDGLLRKIAVREVVA
ncbi:hypothetical protein DTL00_12870 [Sphingomonas melonis]